MKNHVSERQISILKLCAKGLTMEAIASEIHISINTVKYHKKNLFKLFNVTTMNEALSIAYELKIIG